MNDRELRIECLRLAAQANLPSQTVGLAKEYYNFLIAENTNEWQETAKQKPKKVYKR
jgi:hypothetical protein